MHTSRSRVAGLGVFFPETTFSTAKTEADLRRHNPHLKLVTGMIGRIAGVKPVHLRPHGWQTSDLAAAAARSALAAPRWVSAESVLSFASPPTVTPVARRRGLELPPYSIVVPDARHIVAGCWLPGMPRGALRLRTLLTAGGRGASASERIEIRADAEALIIFTSGTTASPRAVVHSRASLATGLAGFAAHVRFAPGGRVLTDQLMIGIPALIAGAHWRLSAVGTDPGAKPAHSLDVLSGTDALVMVPAALPALLTLLEKHPEKSPQLTTLLIGGAPVLRPLLERVKRRWPSVRICAISGMTEILPVAIADGDAKLAFVGPGDCVGTVLPAIRARIELNAAGDGELVLAGDGLAPGCLAELPGHPLVCLNTGDLAEFHGDSLVPHARSKDMFIRGSTNVYPGLYEPVIAGIVGVADVAIVGVADDIGDARIVLPGLVDAAVLPDLVLIAAGLPWPGRSNKLDRAALSSDVAHFIRSGY